jgi:hypothetical protein
MQQSKIMTIDHDEGIQNLEMRRGRSIDKIKVDLNTQADGTISVQDIRNDEKGKDQIDPEPQDRKMSIGAEGCVGDSDGSTLLDPEISTIAAHDQDHKENHHDMAYNLKFDPLSPSPLSSAISTPNEIPEEKNLQTTSITTPLPLPTEQPNDSSYFPSSESNHPLATFVHNSKKRKYVPTNTYRLRNSLLLGVGFLELANAGDFAANVWNTIPVPTFAAVLMG